MNRRSFRFVLASLPASPFGEVRPRRAMLGAIALFLLFVFSSCDRPTRPDATVAVFTDGDLSILAQALNRQIALGEVAMLDSGLNIYRVALPGAMREVEIRLDMEPRTLQIPFGFAEVRLNALRFDRATYRWNARREALQLQLDLRDKEDGVLADVHVLGIVQRQEILVSSGRLDIYLPVRVGPNGGVELGPVTAEISVNTDDAIPAVREPLRQTLRQVEEDMSRQLREQFEQYDTDLTAWIAGQLAPNARIEDITITDDAATVRARRAEDVTGDGIIDIADLVFVGQEFGQRSVASRADVNDDGIVDIRDLVRVAVHVGARKAWRVIPRRGRKR